MINVFKGESGIVIHANYATIKVGSNVSGITIYGSGNTIDGSSGDGIYVNGTQDRVYGNNLNAQYNGLNTGDDIFGTGDSGAGYESLSSGTGYDYGLDGTGFTAIYGYIDDDGFAAGALSKLPNLSSIAEFSTASVAASASSEALQGAEQAMQASVAPSAAAAPSPFEGQTWSGSTVTWDFANAGAGTPITRAVDPLYQAAVIHAFQIWSSAANIQFEQVASGTSADIHIGFYDLNSVVTGLMGSTMLNESGGTIETSSVIQLEDPSHDPIGLDGDGRLSYLASDVELEQLALHEIGHMLGLADNADPHSIMYAELGTTNRTLDQSDITNIQALYDAPKQSSISTGLLVQAMATFTDTSAAPIALASSLPAEPTITLATNAAH